MSKPKPVLIGPDASLERPDKLTALLCRVPPLFRGTFERAFLGKSSPRGAIKAKCQECVGYEETIDRVRNCRVLGCPLWTYRPYQEKQS